MRNSKICYLVSADRASATAKFVLLYGFTLLLLATPVLADNGGYFRIATGATSGTYFPVGSLIASVISNPRGSPECGDGGSCGVPGLIAVGQASKGSVDNVTKIAKGIVESGFSQADVAYMAYKGLGRFKGGLPYDNLRVVATLYQELVQLAVRKSSGIYSFEDLRGKRVSLGAVGSGTAVDSEVIMAAHNLNLTDYKAVHFDLGEAADRLRLGKLDAFFIIAGAPVPALEDLAEQIDITLLPIHGPATVKLRQKFPFFITANLLGGTYRNVQKTVTLSVGAQWLVSTRLSSEKVFEMTRALWHPSTRQVLDNGHPVGRQIRLKTALNGLAIPLHDGAKLYYQKIGALPR